MLAQLIGTPLHLIALDYYNHPSTSFGQRMAFLRAVFANSLFLRILRFLPTYGIGGIVNIELRCYFQNKYGQE
jgi:hypothetical protein